MIPGPIMFLIIAAAIFFGASTGFFYVSLKKINTTGNDQWYCLTLFSAILGIASFICTGIGYSDWKAIDYSMIANDKCLVFITTSAGDGATIKAAKMCDADNLDQYRTLGITPLPPQRLERAEYVFKVFRGKKECGSVSRVPCLALLRTVNITEEE